jgi:hypothetical protein
LPKGKEATGKSALIYRRIDVKRLANDSTKCESQLSSADAAQTIVDGLKGAGINLIATLPDINLSDLLLKVEEDGDFIHCAGKKRESAFAPART